MKGRRLKPAYILSFALILAFSCAAAWTVIDLAPEPVDTPNAVVYELIDLGVLPGDVRSAAYDVNDAGLIVGVSIDQDGAEHPVVWENGKIKALPVHTGWRGRANGINEAGQIVGCIGLSLDRPKAAIWEKLKLRELVALKNAASEAEDINDAGTIVGWLAEDQGYSQACIWESGNQKLLSGVESWAQAVNKHNMVVGLRLSKGAEYSAFLWQDSKVKDYKKTNESWTEASDINDTGQIVGFVDTHQGKTYPVLWDKDKSIYLDKEQLYNGHANAINNNGQIVGYYISGKRRAFVWESGQIVTLDSLPPKDKALSQPPDTAYGINNNGWIVGVSGEHAVLWKPRTKSKI